MATRIDETCRLQIKVVTGQDESGKQVVATRSFGNISPDVSDADLLSVGGKFAALQKFTPNAIVRNDTATLDED